MALETPKISKQDKEKAPTEMAGAFSFSVLGGIDVCGLQYWLALTRCWHLPSVVEFSVLLLHLLAKTNDFVSLSREFVAKDFYLCNNLSVVGESHWSGSKEVCAPPFSSTALVPREVGDCEC
jgi:hypothetical protein